MCANMLLCTFYALELISWKQSMLHSREYLVVVHLMARSAPDLGEDFRDR